MAKSMFPTSCDIYLEAEGKKIAVVQDYNVAARKTERAIEAFGPIDSSEWNHLKNDVRESVQRYIYDTIKRNPMIMPIIVEI